jgi:hypothetical protein
MLKQEDQFRVDSNYFEPAYMELHRDGEFWRRWLEVTRALEFCILRKKQVFIELMKEIQIPIFQWKANLKIEIRGS